MSRLYIVVSLLFIGFAANAQIRESVGEENFSDWKNITSVRSNIATITSGEEISYTYPDVGNRVHGFRTYHNGRNWGAYKGLSFEIFLKKGGDTQVELAFRVAPENEDSLEPLSTAKLSLYKEGWNRVFVAWDSFSLRAAQQGTLEGVHNLSLKVTSEGNKTLQIKNVELLKGETISMQSPIQGRAADAGGSVRYSIEVGNTTRESQVVDFQIPTVGWEAMKTTIYPQSLSLKAGEVKSITVEVALPASLPQGTNEVQQIKAVVAGTQVAMLPLTTSVRVESPYIVHNLEGWDEVKDKAKNYDWAQKELERYDREATKWSVPAIAKELPTMNTYMGRYLFHSSQGDYLMDCAIAYRLTGKKEHAQKCLDFLRAVIDEKSGYPVTLRVNQNNFVKEGGIFQNIARTYDMIYDCGLFTAEDHRLIEQTFRLFIDTVLMGNNDGGIGNWDLSELTGALYCALMVQDYHLAKCAFEGIHKQFMHGVMSDGWWYECSVGYNLWCATMFSEAAVALKPWGYNFLDELIPIGKVPHYSLLPLRMKSGLFGMDFNKWGRIEKNAIGVKSMWDALVPMLDYRGVMFAVNDAQETSVIGEPFEMAYYLFRDPEYAAVVKMGDKRDLLYGVPELPDFESVKNKQSAYADNMGIVQLRSQKQGREQREQIQAALHYGTHGGFHGHFDRTNLLSMMRYGRSFYNPEMIWYGYQSYNYKFLVQTSMTKNMVVVDQKMQEPVESARTMFYTGDMVQATAVQTRAKWSNPPYGGMIYGDKADYTFRQKAWEEGRTFDFAADEPAYGELTEFTEPITQRRLMVMMDDYIVLADYVEGEVEHTYDWLFQMKGFYGLNGEKKAYLRHDNQLSTNPLGAAQFFTNCDWFSMGGTVRSHYEMKWGEGSDNAGTRTPNSEDGVLKIDVLNAWPRTTEVTVATVPESHGVNKQLWYEVEADGKMIHRDSTGAWILGSRDISLDIAGRKELKLKTKIKRKADKNTLFWGDAKLILRSGEEVELASLPVKYSNTLQPRVKGTDYYGGVVTIAGERITTSIPAEPAEASREAEVVVDIAGLDAVKFVARIGSDFPLGDESQRRRTLNVRTQGKSAEFLAVIEPYEESSVVRDVVALSADRLTVTLTDGRRQEITIKNLASDPHNITVEVKEFDRSGELLREEIAK